MKRIIDLSAEDAKNYFLKESSYFRDDFPEYISFQPTLDAVSKVMGDKVYTDYLASLPKPNSTKMTSAKPADFADVNYKFTANKDGRFGWRPYELVHPAIYVSLVNLICDPANWTAIIDRFKELEAGIVECCSAPVISEDNQSDIAAQVRGWWLDYEQKSIALSLDFTHLLQSDVTDCYGSLSRTLSGMRFHTRAGMGALSSSAAAPPD